jgi:valyl-tRNA synthetase
MGKFVGSVVKRKPYQREDLHPIDKWMLSRFTKTWKLVTQYYEHYQFDRAMREIEQFAWHEFADHYIEMVKHRTRDEKDEAVRYTLYTVCLGIMKMVAPLMPHVTEEVYQENFKRIDKAQSIHVSRWPFPTFYDDSSERKGLVARDIVSAVRSWKADHGLPLNLELASVEIIGPAVNMVEGSERDIRETIKAKELLVSKEAALEEKVIALKPVPSKIGPQFKAKAKEVSDKVRSLKPEENQICSATSKVEIRMDDGSTIELNADCFEVQKELTLHGKTVETIQLCDLVLAIQK